MSAVKPRHCGACEVFVPPDDKHWRIRRYNQHPGHCKTKNASCQRDDACCEKYVARSLFFDTYDGVPFTLEMYRAAAWNR